MHFENHIQTPQGTTIAADMKWSKFADDILKRTSWISINISLKFVPMGPIDEYTGIGSVNDLVLKGDKPFYKPIMA